MRFSTVRSGFLRAALVAAFALAGLSAVGMVSIEAHAPSVASDAFDWRIAPTTDDAFDW